MRERSWRAKPNKTLRKDRTKIRHHVLTLSTHPRFVTTDDETFKAVSGDGEVPDSPAVSISSASIARIAGGVVSAGMLSGS